LDELLITLAPLIRKQRIILWDDSQALRKGREDNRDVAGAVDFYYGEMEMRRQSPSSGSSRVPRGIRIEGAAVGSPAP
jgi:hypothetical protein